MAIRYTDAEKRILTVALLPQNDRGDKISNVIARSDSDVAIRYINTEK